MARPLSIERIIEIIIRAIRAAAGRRPDVHYRIISRSFNLNSNSIDSFITSEEEMYTFVNSLAKDLQAEGVFISSDSLRAIDPSWTIDDLATILRDRI